MGSLRETMAVPEEILQEEILIRLPVKSLVRFRSVCKFWNYLFSDHKFIKFHLARTSRDLNQDALIFETLIFPNNNFLKKKEISILRRSDFINYPLQGVPFNYPHNSIKLIGSINGLVCLQFRRLGFILWNPSTRQSVNIKPPVVLVFWNFLEQIGIRRWFPISVAFCGFGWDPVENDYKVLVCYRNKIFNRGMIVYSTKTNSWTQLVVPPNEYRRCAEYFRYPSTIVKGCPYWSYNSSYRNKFYVVKFEVGTNECRLLPQVDLAIFGETKFIALNWKDCLAGVVCNKVSSRMELYCLDEGCGVWSKMFTFNLDFREWEYDQPSYCFKYGAEIVLNRNKHVYDPKTNELRCIRFAHLEELVCNGYSYTDSLVYVNGMKLVHSQSLWRSLASLLLPRCMKDVAYGRICGLLIMGAWSIISSRRIDLNMRNTRRLYERI